MVLMMIPKLTNAKTKNASSKFFIDAVNRLAVQLTKPEAETLHKVISEALAKRKKALDDKALADEQAAKAAKKAADEAEGKALPTNEVSDADFFADMM
eukprot:NODE_7103_length_461_cov_189.408867.p2 GENE.NODE_7103_length_461_cov_189.408867~~NODE_7103_length_461_cov_189.408867.p2  ORF type:complete len:107 (+),score=40.66 NODE_7103_length_461_cov_189.408867:30-323(+)